MRRAVWLLLLCAACGDAERETAPSERVRTPPEPVPADPPPERTTRIRFDHIVISFRDAVHSRNKFRPRAAARKLAYSIYDRVRSGMDWDTLKREYTDDRNGDYPLGPYTLVEAGLPYAQGEIPRDQYARELADRIFGLKMGEIAIVDYDPVLCPFGWHIVKRVPMPEKK